MPTVEEQALVASEEMLLTEEQELLDSLAEQVAEHDEYLRSIGMGEEEADPSDAHVDIHIDGAAFVDSLGYMLKGMVGIFLVIAIIMVVIMTLNKVTGKEKKKKEA